MAKASPAWIEAAAGLWPGLAAAGLCGATALGAGAQVAAGVAGALALPFGAASAAAAALRPAQAPERAPTALAAAALVATPVLTVFGALLKANTHHKALAGVTFAVVGAGVAAGAWVVGARGAQVLGRLGEGARRGSAVALLLAASAVGALLVLRGGGQGLDVVLLLAAVAAGWAGLPGRSSRALGAGALAAGVGLALLGLALSRSPDVARAVQSRSILAVGVLAPLGSPGGASLAEPPSHP